MPLFFFFQAYLWSGAATLIHFWLKYASRPTLDVVKSRRSLLSTRQHLDFSGRFKDDPSMLYILRAVDWWVGRAPSYPVLYVYSAVTNTLPIHIHGFVLDVHLHLYHCLSRYSCMLPLYRVVFYSCWCLQ